MIRPLPILLLAALGCASASEIAGRVVRELNPVGSYEVRVVSSAPRGPYLDARLVGTDFDLRLLFPASERCARLLVPETRTTWQREGIFGAVRGPDGESCDAVGVASLAAWRDRHPRPPHGGAFPRETARYRVVHRDEDAVLVRGRFLLASLVGIQGYDVVALIPATEACRAPLARSESTLEFRDSGPIPYRLVSPDGSCPVLGFALPPSVAAGPEDAP